MMGSVFLEGGADSWHTVKEFMLVVAHPIVPAEGSSGTMRLIYPAGRICLCLPGTQIATQMSSTDLGGLKGHLFTILAKTVVR